MKYIYPAIFILSEKKVLVVFPDFPSFNAYGKDINDAFNQAIFLLNSTLYNMEQSNMIVPIATNPKDISISGNSFISLVSADTFIYKKIMIKNQ